MKSANSTATSDTLIIVPLAHEFRALTRYVSATGYPSEVVPVKTSPLAYPQLGVVVATGGHGKTQFATTAQYLVDHCGPFNRLIATGTAGALTSTLAHGDVVIGDATIEHDYRQRFRGEKPPPRHLGCSVMRETVLTALPTALDFTVHVGGIASGDEDIVDAARAAEVYQRTEALCVAWEGAGGARVAQFNDIPFLEIRAITDIANRNTIADFKTYLNEAMAHIGELLVRWRRR